MKKLDASGRGLDLAEGDQDIGAGFEQGWQVRVCANNGVAEHLFPDLLRFVHDSCNLIFPLLLDHIDAGFTVSTAANQENL